MYTILLFFLCLALITAPALIFALFSYLTSRANESKESTSIEVNDESTQKTDSNELKTDVLTEKNAPLPKQFDVCLERKECDTGPVECRSPYASTPVFGIFLDQENEWGHKTQTEQFYREKLGISGKVEAQKKEYEINTPHNGKDDREKTYKYPDHFVQLAIVAGFLRCQQDSKAFDERLNKIAVFGSSMGFSGPTKTLLDDKQIYISGVEYAKNIKKDLLLIPLYDEGSWHHQCIIIDLSNKHLIYIEPLYTEKRLVGNPNNIKDSTKRAVAGLINYCKNHGYKITEQMGHQQQKDCNSCGILCAQSMIEVAMEFLEKGTVKKVFPTFTQRESYRANMRIEQMKMQAHAPRYLMRGEVMQPSSKLEKRSKSEKSAPILLHQVNNPSVSISMSCN